MERWSSPLSGHGGGREHGFVAETTGQALAILRQGTNKEMSMIEVTGEMVLTDREGIDPPIHPQRHTYLDEANIGGILTEALAAQIKTVFADQTHTMGAYAALS